MHIRSSFNPTLAMFDCLRSTDSHLVQVNALPLVIFNLVKLFKLISFVVKLNFILQLLLLLIIILFLLVHCRSQLVQLFSELRFFVLVAPLDVKLDCFDVVVGSLYLLRHHRQRSFLFNSVCRFVKLFKCFLQFCETKLEDVDLIDHLYIYF